MNAYILTGIICSVALSLGVVGALFTWVYKRGKAESSFESSLTANTKSNEELTGAVSTLKDSLVTGFREVHDRIDKHDVEIAVARRDIEHLTATLIVAHQRSVE